MIQERTNNQDQLPDLYEAAETISWLVHVTVGALGAMVIPFSRRGFGSRYLAVRGIVGLVFFWFYGIAVSPENTILYSTGTFAWVIMVLWSGAGPNNEFDGMFIHSSYSGWPRVGDLFRISEGVAKGAVEPLTTIGIGVLVASTLDVGFGVFIMLGGGGAWVEYALAIDARRRQLRQLHDAELEADALWNAYDDRYGRPRD